MGVIDDIFKVFDRIPLVKRFGQMPAQVDDLQKRLSDLETKLSGKWPGDVCRFCGERTARLSANVHQPQGYMVELWNCSACGQQDQRISRG